MRFRASCALLSFAAFCQISLAGGPKTYKHATEYQVAVLDQTLRIQTGTDATLGHTSTDSKLDGGGQGVHFLHTDSGDYRVEAPVNSGATFLSAMAATNYRPAVTVHNKWFLDKVQSNTQVLFAAKCAGPNKKHPSSTVHCTFWFPDPDSDSHEYMTLGDFTPYIVGNGANTDRVANTLCGTGKLNAETEAKLCSTLHVLAPMSIPTPAPIPATPAVAEQAQH